MLIGALEGPPCACCSYPVRSIEVSQIYAHPVRHTACKSDVPYLLVDLHAHRPLRHVPHHASLAVVVLVRHALQAKVVRRKLAPPVNPDTH